MKVWKGERGRGPKNGGLRCRRQSPITVVGLGKNALESKRSERADCAVLCHSAVSDSL